MAKAHEELKQLLGVYHGDGEIDTFFNFLISRGRRI